MVHFYSNHTTFDMRILHTNISRGEKNKTNLSLFCSLLESLCSSYNWSQRYFTHSYFAENDEICRNIVDRHLSNSHSWLFIFHAHTMKTNARERHAKEIFRRNTIIRISVTEVIFQLCFNQRTKQTKFVELNTQTIYS